MRAGSLDRRIQLQRRVRKRTRRGEQVDEWKPLGTCWAKKRRLSVGRRGEQYEEDQFIAKGTMEWTVRWRTDVNPKDRLLELETGRLWDITSVIEIGRHAGLKLIAEAREDED